MRRGFLNLISAVLTILCLLVQAHAQTTSCEKDPAQIPNDSTPIKHVRVAIHVIQKEDSTDNFPENQESKDWIRYKLFGNVNGVMGNLDTMNLPTPSPYIRDSRIRIVLDTIYFHQNTSDWDMHCPNTSDCPLTGTLRSLYTKYVLDNPAIVNKTDAIHFFFGGNSSSIYNDQGAAELGNLYGCTNNIYQRFLQNNHWNSGGIFRHELGHCLGLYHTVSNCGDTNGCEDACDDTPTIAQMKAMGWPSPNCWNDKKCSNNMMDYNASESALTAQQLIRMHCYLSGNMGSGNPVFKAVIEKSPVPGNTK